MIDYTKVVKTSLKCILDYTYATFIVNRSVMVFVAHICNLNIHVNVWEITEMNPKITYIFLPIA